MVEGSEESQEKENFRGNKEDYSVSKAFLDRRGVVSLECPLSNDISSSLVYC